MKTAHLITGLNRGGAETMLYRLMKYRKHLGGTQIVISLLSGCAMEEDFKNLGVKVYSLDMKRKAISFSPLFTLIRILKTENVDILQTWMYHADLLGTLIYKFAKIKCLVWNIRCADLELNKYSRLTKFVVSICARLSNIPDAVIVNSQKGLETHKSLGYRPKHWALIYNGFELDKYIVSSYNDKRLFRQKYNIPEDAFVFGMAARYDPAKDFNTLFKSMDYFYSRQKNESGTGEKLIIFALCGKNICESNTEIMCLIKQYSLEGHVVLLDELSNITEFYAILNTFVLSSVTEGFSNTLGEAMACGLPVVVTNAGDNVQICSGIGFVTDTRDYKGLAQGYKHTISLTDEEICQIAERSRNHIRINFSIETIAKKYGELYTKILNHEVIV